MIDPSPSDQFRIGDLLNNTYQIEGILGRGGTGEVYCGRNQVTGRVVAIKVLSRQFSHNADFVELMKREEEMRAIHHDAVVRYTECSRAEGGQVFLVMDFIDGPSLGDEMGEERFDPRELLIIAHRVAQGLAAAHARGIVHRDLSPDNVVLRNGRPEAATLIDFGIAKDTAAGARTLVGDQFAGKYEYAAPEQFEGTADARTDLYGLGATLLAVWLGETPFAGATPGEIVRRKMAPLDLARVPEPLAGLIGWLTAPDPADRPADTAEALVRIESLLGGEPAAETSPASPGQLRSGPEPEPAAPGARRHRRRLWPAAAALALAALVAAYLDGVFDRFLTPPLPVADPYFLTAAAGPDGEGTLVGNAPDEPAASALVAAYAEASGAPATSPDMVLAQGMPSEDWSDRAAEILRAFGALEAWALTLEDLSLRANGVAPDAVQRDAASGRISALAEDAGFSATLDIRSGPLRLPASAVEAVLREVATCGVLSQGAPDGGVYNIDDTVTVTGAISEGTDVEAVRLRLGEAIGDRKLRMETERLNAAVCAVRESLPAVGSGDVSIWLGNGESGETNLSGVFRTEQNPVAEVRLPANMEGLLWVMVVDVTGTAFALLPSEAREENRLAELGVVDGGVRRVRVLWSVSEIAAEPSRVGFRISKKDYGKSELIAIVTRSRLFATRRPLRESAESLSEALADAFSDGSGDFVAIATRNIDARP